MVARDAASPSTWKARWLLTGASTIGDGQVAPKSVARIASAGDRPVHPRGRDGSCGPAGDSVSAGRRSSRTAR
jgi:hypothetical protein